MSSKRWSIRFKSGGFNLSAAVDEDDGACDAEAIVARETRTSNQSVNAAVLVSLNGDSPAQPFKDQQPNNGTVRICDDLGLSAVVYIASEIPSLQSFFTLSSIVDESRKKDDRLDAQTLARLARIDPELLSPVKHRSAKAQADLTVIRARAGLVRARTALVNTARGLAKSYGERLRGCNVRNMNPEKAEGLSPELQVALQPLLAALESLSERIAEYNEGIEKLAKESYPQVALLKQVKGVGTLIGLTFLLTLEDPHRFRKSRDVGCYLGLQPGRRNSGQSEPQMHISKQGDPYLRTLLVQGAQHILGPFGAVSPLCGGSAKSAHHFQCWTAREECA